MHVVIVVSNPILVLVYCFIWVGCEKFSFVCKCNFVKLNEMCARVLSSISLESSLVWVAVCLVVSSL